MKTINLIFMLGAFLLISCSDDEMKTPELSGEGIFYTKSDNAEIEGELFLPEGTGPYPIVIVVPGSGNETRESLKSFIPFFEGIGFGIYIYDKRGIGGSTGAYPVEDPVNPIEFLLARSRDITGIVDLLKSHEAIQKDKIILFGSSQGTWVSNLVFDAISDDIGLMVMASGGAASTGEERYYEELIEDQGLSIAEANDEVYNYQGHLGYDPKESIKSTDIPTLFIYGGQDESHPTRYDKWIIEAMDKSNFTVHYHENADHSLLDIDTQSFPVSLFPMLADWLTTN